MIAQASCCKAHRCWFQVMLCREGKWSPFLCKGESGMRGRSGPHHATARCTLSRLCQGQGTPRAKGTLRQDAWVTHAGSNRLTARDQNADQIRPGGKAQTHCKAHSQERRRSPLGSRQPSTHPPTAQQLIPAGLDWTAQTVVIIISQCQINANHPLPRGSGGSVHPHFQGRTWHQSWPVLVPVCPPPQRRL